MTGINKLKELAESAGAEEWQFKRISGDNRVILKGSFERGAGYVSCCPVVDEMDNAKQAKFIAAANPKAIIGLIERLEAAEAELARRDAATGEPVGYFRQFCGVWHSSDTKEKGCIPLFTAAPPAPSAPPGWKIVPIEPTKRMVIDGFESEPDETYSEPGEWEKYSKMSGCQQAAYKARLCWAAMLAAAPAPGGE